MEGGAVGRKAWRRAKDGAVEEEGVDGYCRWKAVPWQWPAARGGGDLGACGGEETGREASGEFGSAMKRVRIRIGSNWTVQITSWADLTVNG